MTRGRTRLACAAALALSLAPAPARANPADIQGFGARAAAMGGAAAAVAVDGAANYYNPAGLARDDRLRLDVGYQAGQPWLTFDGADAGERSAHGLTVGLVAPGVLFGTRVALGVALLLPDDQLALSRSRPFAQPRFVYYDNRPHRIYLAANVAVRLPGRVYLGAGLSFMARTNGTVELSGLVGFADPEGDTRLVSAVAVDLLAARYPQAGIAWEATRWLTLAGSFRGSFLLHVDEGFEIRGDVGNPGGPPLIAGGTLIARTASTDLFQPWQVTAAAAARITRRWLLAFDLVFARWSEFETPAATVRVDLALGPVFDPLVRVAPPRTFPRPGFRDTLSPRVGLEWRALERGRLALDLRAGWNYEASPVPEQTRESNYADCDKHTLALGAGLAGERLAAFLPRGLALDANVALTVLPPRAHHKVDPADPIGDWVAAGVALAGGATLRMAF